MPKRVLITSGPVSKQSLRVFSLNFAAHSKATHFFNSMIYSIMWNIPARLVNVVEGNLFTKLILYHFIDVLLLEVNVSLQFLLEILKPLLNHKKIFANVMLSINRVLYGP